MPTYEYACDACGDRFELFLPMSAKVVQPCPACGGEAKRLISGGAGLIFKGSGFYITDYRSKDYTEKAKADKSNGAGTSTGASTDAAKKEKPSEKQAGTAAKA
jgi:putative FmdB family regulatory protein